MTSRVSGETQTCVRLAVNATTSGEDVLRLKTRRMRPHVRHHSQREFVVPGDRMQEFQGERSPGKNPETQEGSEPRASQPDPERLLHRFQHEV